MLFGVVSRLTSGFSGVLRVLTAGAPKRERFRSLFSLMDTARRSCFCVEGTVTGIQLPHCQFSMNSQVLWDAFCAEFFAASVAVNACSSEMVKPFVGKLSKAEIFILPPHVSRAE